MSSKDNYPDEVFDDLSSRVARVAKGLRITRATLVLFGSLVVAVAGAFLSSESAKVTLPQAIVIMGACVAFIGGVIAAWSEEDPREAIDKARREQLKAERFQGRGGREISDQLLSCSD